MAGTEANLLNEHTYHVASEGAVVAVRRTAKEMAIDSGFSAVVAEEVALAVGELAQNIVRHAGSGQIVLSIVRCGADMGIQVDASDQGEGIADPNIAMTDGYSTAGGLGCGLGAVNRLMDQLNILSSGQFSQGAHIRCVRWNRPAIKERLQNPLDIGVVSQSKLGENVNGDAYLVVETDQTSLAAVIDGVGHGAAAHQAATTVHRYVETHAREPLDRILTGASHNCRATRGAVMALVRIDWRTGVVQHAGVGNIETRLLAVSPGILLPRRGILGHGTMSVRVNRQVWGPGDVLVLFSDGLRSSWRWEQFPSASVLSSQQLARELFDELVRGDDDATVLVVKYRSS